MKISAFLAASLVNAHYVPSVEDSLTAGLNETLDMPEYFQQERALSEECKSLKAIGLDFVGVRSAYNN